MCGIALSPKKQLIFAGERRCFQCEFMVQGVCPGRSGRFFRDKQSRRVGGNGEVGEKRGGRRRREMRKEKSEKNAKGEDGKKRGGEEKKHSEK